MSVNKPYIIRHIQLQDYRSDIDIDDELKYYFLCWYKDIPLGHFFVEAHEHLKGPAFRYRMWEAIAPTIHFFQQKAEPFEVRSLLVQEHHMQLYKAMDSLLANYVDPPPLEQSEVSVIICTRNRSEDLKRCLASLLSQTSVPKQIVVVDNAPSDDSTRRVVENFKANNIVYYKEPRGGLSIARNAGLRLATADIIAFTDDDVRLHPNWLHHLQQSFELPQVGAMTGLVIASSLATDSQQLFEKEWSFNGGYCDKYYDNSYFNKHLRTGPRVWDIGAGANMAFRRSALQQAGFFDERLGAGAAGCSEDSEMWYRILAKGISIHYNPRALVFHEHRREMRELHRQIFAYMRGHAVAALIQQRQTKEAGYKKYLYRKITKSYMPRLVKKLFRAHERHMLWIQLSGMFSGIWYFMKHRNKPSQTN